MLQEHFQNVIIGGGPAGLNMALEFSKRGIKYLLLEASDSPGGQWDRLPIYGQLISLNKKYVPDDSHTYKMRYDWHTLSTISAEDVEKDPKLRFTEWTDEPWPSAHLYKEYLKYIAEHMGLMESICTNRRVRRISRVGARFILMVEDQYFSADRVFCAIGASSPAVPNIKGLNKNTATFYQDLDPSTAAKRYRNKIVVVLGDGNSAFEIAHHLIGITAETRVVIPSELSFARQTHNVHHVRAQVLDPFDLMQLKANNNVVSDRIVEVSRIEEGENKGRLRIHYKSPCVHWDPPRWMQRSGIVDEMIICGGFNYTIPNIFEKGSVNPKADEKGKYYLLTSTWESVNVPGLYFIGASMRVNDPDSASGFVHGFRCNIQALGYITAEKYHSMPLEPVFECKVIMENPADALVALSEYLVKWVSDSMPLFELFHYFGAIVTFENVTEDNDIMLARVWPPFPREYNHERWHDTSNRVEIVFEYGFHRYGDGNLPTHYFTLPADHFDTSKSAYIHPVFHVFREGIEVDAFHMQESLTGRWDRDDYIDPETNPGQYKNVVFNASACALGLEERRSTLPVREEFVRECYPLMNQKEIKETLRAQPTLGLLIIRNKKKVKRIRNKKKAKAIRNKKKVKSSSRNP